MIQKIIEHFNDGFLYGIGYIIGRFLGFCYQHPMLILGGIILLVSLKLVNRDPARSRISNR